MKRYLTGVFAITLALAICLTSPAYGQISRAGGAQGLPGHSVLNGSGVPGGGTGANGDFYIDTTAHAIYGPKTAGAWGSATSLIGPSGTAANTIWNGSGDPSTGDGVDGDFWINTTSNKIFGPKATTWPAGVSLVGPAGSPGSPGSPGADGKTVLNGTAVPTTEGTLGDFYLKTDTSDLYGPKTGGGWGSPVSLLGSPGSPGSPGAPGADGKTLLNGTSVPTTEGVVGDFYLKTDTSDLYGPKSGGGWGSPVNLIGPQGPPGTTSFANPSASVGTSAVNGSASTAMRSDGAPAINQTMTPTWTGKHTFNAGLDAVVPNAGIELITNVVDRDFSGAGDWVLDANWAIAAGKMTHTVGATDTATLPHAYLTTGSVEAGKIYQVTFTISGWTNGAIKPKLGAATPLYQASGNDTFHLPITALVNDVDLIFEATGDFDGSIDNVSLKLADSGLFVLPNGQAGFNTRTPNGLVEIFGKGSGSVFGSPTLLHLAQTADDWILTFENSNPYDSPFNPFFAGIYVGFSGELAFATSDDAGSYVTPFTLLPKNYNFLTQTEGVVVGWQGRGNLSIGTSQWDTGIENGLIFLNGTAPSTSIADQIQLWAADYGTGDSRLYVKSEAGDTVIIGNGEIRSAGNLNIAAAGTVTMTGVPSCSKYTVAYDNAAFTAGATTANVTIASLPAYAKVTGVTIKHSAPFVGAGMTTTTVSLGDGSNHTAYSTPAFDIAQASADTTFQDTAQYKSTTMAGSNLVAHFLADVNFGASAVPITAATNASTVELTAVGHGLKTGATVEISGATGAWAAINGTFSITWTSADTFTITVDSTTFGTLSGSPVFNAQALSAGSVDLFVCSMVLPGAPH